MDKDKCCELVDKKDWEEKNFTWKNKPFVKKKYFALFYMPIGVDGVLKDLMAELHEKKLLSEEHPVMLWRNEGLFGGEILVALKNDSPDYETVTLSGKYFSKFYEGKGYEDAGKWHKDFQETAKSKDLKLEEVLTYYLLCPGCLKKFGKMQTVIFGKASS
jgi:hypothetical protein